LVGDRIVLADVDLSNQKAGPATARALYRRKAEARGTRVIVTGRIKQRSYENKDGRQVTVTEIEASDVGLRLQRANVKVTKTQRSRAETGNGFGGDAPEEPPF
jgi:single-stranded DNA-binding protein